MNTKRNVLSPASAKTNILQKYLFHPDFLGMSLTDVNQRGSSGDSPLHIAVRSGSEQDVIDLIGCGASLNMAGDIGNTPLHFAAMKGRESMVQLLLKKGANPKALNDFNETPLKVARQGGRKGVVAILQALGD